MNSVIRFGVGLLAVVPTFASATIISITSGDALLGNHGTNMIVNGSFEADAGNPNQSFWANGTTNLPFLTLTGWQTLGQPNTYAVWGNDGNGRLRGSELLPDGQNGLYFGGGLMVGTSPAPTFNTDGTVTFSSTPTITPKPGFAPVQLWQTVTGLNTSTAYLLDFWASSEDANASQFPGGDGFFGLDITGESQMYFACPNNVNALGKSQRYYVVFQPNSSTVTFTWTNWGHLPSPGGLKSELVLDDVILNTAPVPEPASMLVVGGGLAAFLKRRRARMAIKS